MKSDRRIGGWYFGWNIVAVATIACLLTIGMRMSIGPFFLPMARGLGLSRGQLASIIAAGMLVYGFGMPLAGYLVARRGTRFVVFLGTAIVTVACIWTSLAHGVISFLLAYGVLLSFGLSFTGPVSLSPVLSRWFIHRRGTALFFISTGSMAGIAVLTPIFTYAIEVVGWRHTLLGFGVVFAVVMFSATFWVIRDDAPEHADLPRASAEAQPSHSARLDSGLSWREAVRTGPFWKVTLGLFAGGYSMILMGTQGVPMLMDHGFDAMTSAFGLGLIGLVAIFGTLVLGRLSDLVPRKYILASIFLIRGLGFFALLMVVTPVELYAVAIVSGVVWAGSIALGSAILADIYGTRLVGILYGLAYLAHQVGATISSWLGGWAYDEFGTHWIAFGSAGVLLFVTAAVSMCLPAKGFTLALSEATPPSAANTTGTIRL